jgi:hypothetical protein
MSAYHAGLARNGSIEIGAARTVSGTINAAVVAYYKSDAFTKGLSPATQKMRRAILERFRETTATSASTCCAVTTSPPCSTA